jgi:hypothetical protein
MEYVLKLKVNMITQTELKKILHYNPDTGIFTRIYSKNKRYIGKETGNLDSDGYVFIRVNGKQYKAHRLAFLYMNGEMPKYTVDHIDRVKNNNSWKNLRDVPMSVNKQNVEKPLKNNSTGYLGVSFYKPYGMYVAGIKVNGIRKTLGYFDSPLDAHNAYLEAKNIYHHLNK